MYHRASAAVAPMLSADDSATEDASSPPPPSLSPDESVRPGGGVLGVLEAEVMVTIDPTSPNGSSSQIHFKKTATN